MIIDGRKCCSSCRAWHPVEMFARSCRTSDGLYGYCRMCSSEDRAVRRASVADKLDRGEIPSEQWCPDCRRTLPAHRFAISTSYGSGLYRLCRGCCSVQERIRRRRAS